MVSEAIKRRFEKVVARVDIVDRNYTLADLAELAQRELDGERVPPLPQWVEAALLTLMGEKTHARVQDRPVKSPTKSKKSQNQQAQRC